MRKLLQAIPLVLPLAVLAAAPREKLCSDLAAKTNLARIASTYIAQENSFLFRMRMPNGSYREFERNFDTPNILRSVNGWRGRIKGDTIAVVSGTNLAGGIARFVFSDGSLTWFSHDGFKQKFGKGTPREPTGGGAPYYFGEEKGPRAAPAKGAKREGGKRRPALDRQAHKIITEKWKGSGRLGWPFRNPNENGCLYAALALLACALFFVGDKKSVKAAGAVLFVAAVGALVATVSRGAILAFACGLVPIAAVRAKALVKSKAFWGLVGAVVLVAAGWLATHDVRLLTRGFRNDSAWSNQVRLEMWRAVPQMMAEAPDGWDFAHVGRAYLDWYQSLGEVNLPGSLMNEHLTHLVASGLLGRFGWLFAWLVGLGFLGLFAWRAKNAVPFGVWLMFAVAGWFNPVFANPYLWIVPGLAVGLSLWMRPWRAVGVKAALVVVGSAVLATVAILGGLWWIGSGTPARGYRVWAQKGRVYVKTLNPRSWVVDDGKALGGVMACKDIRGYYVFRPDAPGVGYVRGVENLPERVDRLVLAGDAGDAWLRKVCSDPAARERLPKRVTFISPPFPPSAVPQGLLQSCSVMFVVGEFAARYEPEYAKPPPWVRIMPGMELYLPSWMELATGG